MNTRTITLNNLNTLFQNAFANNTNLANKEIPTMQPLKAFALTCATLFVALTGAVRPAHADVVVDKIVGPQQTLGVTPGTTALQLKVRNTDGYTVSGVSIQTYIYLASDVNNGWKVRAMPNSGRFSLTPYQSTWITIPIPQYALQGFSLRNQYLYAKALLGSHEYWLNNFYNVPAQANVQSTDIHTTGMQNGAKVFTIKFTNNGYAPSTAQTVKVSTWKDGDGRVGTILTQSATVKALQVGESVTLTFTSQPTEGYDIKGTVQVGTGSIVSFSL